MREPSEILIRTVLDLIEKGTINPFYKTYVFRMEDGRTIAYNAYNEQEARIDARYSQHKVKELVLVELPSIDGYTYKQILYTAQKLGLYDGNIV